MTVHSAVIQKLLSTNAHLGHHIAAHHFKIFTYGARNGVAIIDSDKTLICLRNALNFIGALARQRAQFMFVNTNSLYDEIFDQMTRKIGCKYDNKWRVGGLLTNNFSPKKFRSRNKRLSFSPARLPDCLVIVDTERKSSIITEADKLQIPVIALVDSNMPSKVFNKITYPIPANDSVQFVYLFCNLITKTFLLEQNKFTAHGDSVEEVDSPQLASPTTGEDVQLIEHSKADSADKGVLVAPYQSLAPIPNDLTETKQMLDKLLVLQLNDGLGTMTGFSSSKLAVEVCNGMNFLDLVINQIESLNSKYGCSIPLLLMDTVKTRDDTQKVLDKYSKANINIHTFIQGQHPQVKDFEESNNENELSPPAHGSGLFSLMGSEALDVLLRQGKEYILIITADNMAAVVDPKILNHLIQHKIECCLEVTPTTFSDLKDSSSISQEKMIQLSEIAQLPAKHPMEKFKFIFTKNMWVNLNAMKGFSETEALRIRDNPTLEERGGSRTLVQETEVGSALRFFDRVVGINVPRSRFLPLEATSDLLLLQSDLYAVNGGLLVRNEARKNPVDPSIELGPEFKQANDFLGRFRSIPSVIELDSLKVTGDVWFGSGITLKGRVTVAPRPGARLEIPDGAVLENKIVNGPGDI